ncbi:hypothetical protein J40TS1_29840 [Paenibacillus montaniterrae]|uniref:SGNH hydrolase-type esterase domain-containing protein n=1 Tax=Paenibacillus montaniterrae TaxID=429341 RepID=A0A919YMS8_9BACL|nr:SGNH/GDSL hydrolase family protein [Paenibacillus montaniterrae]GIP17342.1 hypothetical protein J40TS1_29840 [Paenibacillus montaniterrae]
MTDLLSQPDEKRKGFYILFEAMLEASSRADGKFVQDIYLEGRLADQAKYTGGIDDDSMLELLKSCEGFRRLVHSIGVSVRSLEGSQSEVRFTLENWGKTSKYESGSRISAICPADGSEVVMKLSDYSWTSEDDVLGKFTFEFEQAGALAIANVVFYLHDGYDAPELIADEPVAFDSDAYRSMISRSLLHKGNNYRLKKAIEKAKQGEDVTIAYIGGSITQGAGAKPIHSACYAYQSYLSFKKLFAKNGGEHIHFVKAGVGGTPSELGMIRYERDVLKDGAVWPDIVIVEFAVNDADDETRGKCYESLVLKALAAENEPAVILLFSVFINDWNLQDRLAPVGLHYDLPMVSVKDAVVPQFHLSKEAGHVVTKRQYFYDSYHPTNIGHTIMADCLGWLFAEAEYSELHERDIDLSKPPIIGNDFAHVRLLDRSTNTAIAEIAKGAFHETDTDLQMVEMNDQPFATAQFPHNWMHTAEAGNESFKLKLKSRSLLLVYKDSGSNDFGRADIFVDGKLVQTADPRIINWTHCHATILYNEPEAREHTIEIQMAPGDEHKRFTILAFGYVS